MFETRVLGIGFQRADCYCNTDWKFDQFCMAADRIDSHSSWSKIESSLKEIDEKLEQIGGYDKEIDDIVDNESGMFFGPTWVLKKYEPMVNLMFEAEELLSVLFLTLQGRLALMKAKGTLVFEAAKAEQIIPSGAGAIPLIRGISTRDAWHVANYIKHHDEWQPVLDAKQTKTFYGLRDLGLATGTRSVWSVDKWPVCRAAWRISQQQKFATAHAAIVEENCAFAKACEREILQYFASCCSKLDAARERNIPNIKAEHGY